MLSGEKRSNHLGKAAVFFGLCLVMTLPLQHAAGLRNTLLFLTCAAYFGDRWVRGDLTPSRFDFPLAGFWLIYAAIALLGLWWAVDVAYSLREIKHEILFPILFFLMGWHMLRDFGIQVWFLRSLLLANLALVSLSIVTWMMRDNPNADVGTMLSGVGDFSTYLVTVFPLLMLSVCCLFRGRLRVPVLLLVFSLNVFAVYVTGNRQALIALGLAMLVLLWTVKGCLRARTVSLIVLLLISVFSAIFVHQMARRVGLQGTEVFNISGALGRDGRLPTWRFALGETLKTPWVGGGLGRDTFKHRFPEYARTNPPFVHTHNMLLNRMVQLGVPGLIAFVALLLAPLWLLFKHAPRNEEARILAMVGVAIWLGVFVKNMTDDFFMREHGYFFWLLMGVLLAWQRSAKGVDAS